MNTIQRCCALALFVLPLAAFAAFGPAPAVAAETALPDSPIKITERHTPVAVEYEGTDSIGARLSTRVKELLNSSSLFTLQEKDVPKFRILLTSVPEFPSRPGVGSAYAVVWVFSSSETTLRHFLARDVAVITADEVNDAAAKIVERTDNIAVRYGYLFPEQGN